MVSGTVTVQVGRHRLAATVFGQGAPAVVVEPAFGGCAEDWEKIAETLAGETTIVTYDRAPYGASSAARDKRTPHDIAADLDGLLGKLRVTGPLVLVGHSAGGIYMRAYAAEHLDRVAGMVLVESSHETQRPVLDPLRSVRARIQTVFMIPSIIREPEAECRGADPRSEILEWRAFRKATFTRPALPPGGLGDRPLIVLTCAACHATVPPELYRAWHRLHQDLARLSANSRHLVSESRSHYLNKDDPDLVVSAIRDVIRGVRTGAPLAGTAVGSQGE